MIGDSLKNEKCTTSYELPITNHDLRTTNFAFPLDLPIFAKNLKMAKPIHISSNWTLFLKVFFPVFWGVLFGLLTIAFWVSDMAYVGPMSIFSFRLLITSFFISGLAVFYFSTMQLKRVEIDEHFVYVTNYKDTARYPFHNIQKIEEVNYFLFKVGKVYFKKPGIFGEKAVFLENSFRIEKLLEKRKDLAALFQEEA